jgi:hypothetical protein
MRKLNACLIIVVAIVFAASSQLAIAAVKGKHIDEPTIVHRKATSKSNVGGTENGGTKIKSNDYSFTKTKDAPSGKLYQQDKVVTPSGMRARKAGKGQDIKY